MRAQNWNGEFVKMEGLGNDFVIIDGRGGVALTEASRKLMCDRHFGIGCDQLILLEHTTDADVRMRIFNGAGGEVQSCGNAARCVGALLHTEMTNNLLHIETKGGLIEVEALSETLMRVDLGRVRFDWRDIPLVRATDSEHVSFGDGLVADGCALNIGNPHVVFVNDERAVFDGELAMHGRAIERDALFAEGANVSFAYVRDEEDIRLRVWERGAGMTLACGTAAAAALVVCALRGKTKRKATITLDGGTLIAEWMADHHVTITGESRMVFRGKWHEA